MADETTKYVIEVADAVAPSIETKMGGISAGALKASGSIDALKANLNSLNTSSLRNVSTTLASASASQRGLNTSVTAYARSAAAAQNASARLTASMSVLMGQAAAVTARILSLTSAVSAYNVQASGTALLSAALTTQLNGVGAASNVAAGGTRNFNAALGVARGNITSANRLAGSFLSTLVGGGPIITAAFSALGAIALVGILVQMAQAVYNVVTAYKAMGAAAIAAQYAAIEAGEKTVKAPKSNLFSAAGAAGLFSDSPSPTNITVTQVGPILKQVEAMKQLADAQARRNEADLTGGALARQRAADDIQKVNSLIRQQALIQGVADALKRQGEEQVTVTRQAGVDQYGAPTGQTTTVTAQKITDPKQQAAIQAQFREATQAAKDIGNEINIASINAQAANAKIVGADAKDNIKAARLEMERLNTEYKIYVGNLDHKETPQDNLSYWERAEKSLKYVDINGPKVQEREAAPRQQIAARNTRVAQVGDGLDDQISSIGAYSNALKEKQQLDRITQEIAKTGIPLTQQETTDLRAKIVTIVEGSEYQKELNAQYTAANGPALQYGATRAALTKLEADGAITAKQAAEQLIAARNAYISSTNPMADYQRGLADETALLGKYGTALTVATEIQRQQNVLRATGKHLSDDEVSALTIQLTQLENSKQINADIAALYNANAGALDKLTLAQQANNKAQADGIITARQAAALQLDNQLKQNDVKNAQTGGTLKSNATTVFGGLTDGMRGINDVIKGLDKTFTGFFSTLRDGFADSIGHAIAFGGSVSKALADTARQAVAGLISSLIKLGIEYLVVVGLQKIFNINLAPKNADTTQSTVKNAAVSIAAIAAVTAAQYAAIDLLTGPAWALAEAVSLFSFGANAVPAEAGIAAVVAAGAAQQHLANGGVVRGPGGPTSDSVHIAASNGEYVVNAAATQRHIGILDAINNGRLPVYAAGGYVGSTSGYSQMSQAYTPAAPKFNLNVIHDGSTAIEVRQGPTAQDVMVMAKNAVYTHADDAIGQSMSNANSKTRQATHQNTTALPRRQ